MWEQNKVESINDLDIKSRNKIHWAPKLFKVVRVTHFSEIPWVVEEVNNEKDKDMIFLNSKAINKFLFPNKWVAFYHQFDSKFSFNKVTSAIKEKIMETIWHKSPEKSKVDDYLPKYYFVTLKDSDGKKKYMTVWNLFISIADGQFEQSVIIRDIEKSMDESHQLVWSASLWLISHEPMFQFQ